MTLQERISPQVPESKRLDWREHLVRITLIAVFAGLLLGWLALHTDILFADGLRYVAQAQSLDRGENAEALKKSVDHPLYPIAIAIAHRWIGGTGPDAWQAAAQLASVLAGILLIPPLYLVNRELFGDRIAFPASLLVFVVPLTGHVFADTLSESTFLLFWLIGLWAALRFFKSGRLAWLLPLVIGSVLAYLTRPEGLLLPAATLVTLGLSPFWVLGGLGKRGVAILGIIVIGVGACVGPYVMLKGGIGTKPSVARLLGKAAQSAPHAVERQKPLDPGQTLTKTYGLAAKSVVKAVAEAVSLPLMIFAGVGLMSSRPRDGEARQWRLLAVIGAASLLALVRLHATGGYCSPRHAMILSMLLIPTAAFGIDRVIHFVVSKVSGGRRGVVRTVSWALVLPVFALIQGSAAIAPINEGLGGYRDAGRWLTEQRNDSAKVIDVTGWSQFYSGRTGYSFENLIAAPGDPSARWVVVREAHLKGPWEYSVRLRSLVRGHSLVMAFQGESGPRKTRVLVFDRASIQSTRGAGNEDLLRR